MTSIGFNQHTPNALDPDNRHGVWRDLEGRVIILLFLLGGLGGCATPRTGTEECDVEPLTTAERSVFNKTSTHAEVLSFLNAIGTLPHADRLQHTTMGSSGENKPMPLIVATDGRTNPRKLRILINANIHAGEVEGKEAVQIILREIAGGQHAEILRGADLYFVPNFNPDGNDRMDPKNRLRQNGPDHGVGTRANAGNLDLNRDFLKLESPECRNLVAVFNRYDPHYFLDLHTTNGSQHGYHLTYAPSLSTNVDSGIDDFMFKTLLPEVRQSMADRHAFRVFHYGNFSGRGEKRWMTYDHRPRFGTNYYGLRNRLSVVVEAFSYLSFEDRIRVTRAFVLENLRTAVANADSIHRICAEADERSAKGAGSLAFGYNTDFTPPVEGEILVGSWSQRELPGDLGYCLVADPDCHPERMPISVSFRSAESIGIPWAWSVPKPADGEDSTRWFDAVGNVLLRHGIQVERTTAPVTMEVEFFDPSSITRARRPFQGHNNATLKGEHGRETRTIPTGSLLVRGNQKLNRVAAQLLEPLSEDSLFTWNFFDPALRASTAQKSGWCPVIRLLKTPKVKTEPLAK